MAENGNGTKGWVKWVMGILIVTVLPMMSSVIWCNDKDSRTRDDKLRETQVKCMVEQQMVNQEILIALAEIKSDVRYIKQAGTN